MNSTPEIQILFYQNLGKLFYAIAAADKAIRIEEVEKLKQIVNMEWLNLGGVKDKLEIDAMREIKIIFNQLAAQTQNPNDSMADFKLFKKAHESLFTEDVKQLIWKTASAITTSFSGRNKSELIMLTELGIILKSK
ncbi:MAG: hypothetical protein IPO27_04655 [Bacteroidetes bacterium]|nr:hypothetical protein [Bacteroidota bacterium]